jgi:hypothetical protein
MEDKPPEVERLERPQASLLDDIEKELAEEAALELGNIGDLLQWKKRHAWMTIGIFSCLLVGPLLSVPLALIHGDATLVGLALSIAAAGICAVGSFMIAINKPEIFLIASDGTAKPQKAAKYGFYFLWLTQGGFFLLILALILIVVGLASLF